MWKAREHGKGLFLLGGAWRERLGECEKPVARVCRRERQMAGKWQGSQALVMVVKGYLSS